MALNLEGLLGGLGKSRDNGTSPSDGGASVINTPTPKGPLAIPKLVRGDDGLMHTVYVDAKTGQQLSSLDGYSVLSGAGNYGNPVPAQGMLSGISGLGGGSYFGSDRDDKPFHWQDDGDDQDGPMPSKSSKEAGGKNWKPGEYIDKPGWMKYAAMLPGIGGKIAKVASVAANVNNTRATNVARQGMGLTPMSTKDKVKSTLRDQKGQVADVKINKRDYSVGFEAMSPEGRTNLTPEEARKRGLTLGGIEEIEKRGAIPGVENPDASMMEKLTGKKEGWVGDYLDRKFGGKTADDTVTPSSAAIGATPTPSKDIRVGDLARNPYDTQIGNPQRPTSLTDLSRNPYDTQKSNYVPQTHAQAAGFVPSFGPKRPNEPSGQIVDQVRTQVAQTLGPGYTVVGISGQEDEGKQFGSARHKTGESLDFDVIDPQGNKVTDPQILNDLASQFAYTHPGAGVGFGEGYMAPGRMHLDNSGFGKEWGAKNSRNNMSPALATTIDAARAGFQPTPFANAPTPTTRPEYTPPAPPNVAELGISQPAYAGVNPLDPVGSSLDPIKSTSVFDQIQPNTESYAKSVVSKGIAGQGRGVISEDISNASPAKMAALGLTPRSDAQISQISKAFAGELSPQQLEGIKNGDPVARAEYASMIATAENRVKSDFKGGSLDKVFDGGQYMSMSAANLGTTTQNYSQYKDYLESAARDYYSGSLTPGSYDYSSYYNPNEANPSWGAKMGNVGMVGDHKFGTLSEYGANQTFQDQRNAMAAAQKADPAGFTGVKDYAGSGYSSKFDSPSETSGIGRGSSLSGESSSKSRGDLGSSSGMAAGRAAERSSSGLAAGDRSGSSANSGSSYSGRSGSSGMDSPSETSGIGRGSGGGSSSSSGGTKSGSSGNNSGTSTGSGGGQNASGSSAGAQGRSDGEH